MVVFGSGARTRFFGRQKKVLSFFVTYGEGGGGRTDRRCKTSVAKHPGNPQIFTARFHSGGKGFRKSALAFAAKERAHRPGRRKRPVMGRGVGCGSQGAAGQSGRRENRGKQNFHGAAEVAAEKQTQQREASPRPFLGGKISKAWTGTGPGPRGLRWEGRRGLGARASGQALSGEGRGEGGGRGGLAHDLLAGGAGCGAIPSVRRPIFRGRGEFGWAFGAQGAPGDFFFLFFSRSPNVSPPAEGGGVAGRLASGVTGWGEIC